MTTVLVTAPFPASLMEKLRGVSAHYHIEQLRLSDNKWPEDLTTEAEILYAIGGIPESEQAPGLYWVQGHWAGVNHLLDHSIWDSDVKITTASGIHAPAIGQYVLTQMLAWAQRVPRWFATQSVGQWPTDRWRNFLPDELRDLTLGILGYGSVGREVARLAKSFGMQVLATKRDARRLRDEEYSLPGVGDPDGSMVDRIYPGEATRSMVSECDFVVVALPLTPETHHLVDESVFRRMKPNCFLINVGRGPIISERDLLRALDKGWIAGAGLDVFEEEPLSSESPLWKMENVIISPHVSGFTPHYDERVTDLFAANLRRYLEGQPLFNLVDRKAGY